MRNTPPDASTWLSTKQLNGMALAFVLGYFLGLLLAPLVGPHLPSMPLPFIGAMIVWAILAAVAWRWKQYYWTFGLAMGIVGILSPIMLPPL